MGLFVAGIDTVSRLGQFDLNAVSPEYFATIGTRILRGRGITTEDTPNAPNAAVVSEAMGKVLWPGKDPIGQCMKIVGRHDAVHVRRRHRREHQGAESGG